jgi:hypothetical protein
MVNDYSFFLSLDWDFHFCLIWKQQHFTTGMYVQVAMNCCTLAQSVSDCLQAAGSGFLSFLQVQTICDVISACSTISAIAFFTQIRKWNKGLVAHLLPSSTQVWNMLDFMSPIHLCGITDL